METQNVKPRPGNRRHLQLVLSLLLAAACVWLAFRGVDIGQLLDILAGTSWWLAATAVIALIGMNVVKSAKLGILLRRCRFASLRNIFAAQMVGVLADTIIPFRVQELVKTYVTGKAEGIPVSRVLGAEIITKAIEVLVLCSALVLLAGLHELPGNSAFWIRLLWLGVLGGNVFLFLVSIRTEIGAWFVRRFSAARSRMLRAVGGQLGHLFSGLRSAAVRPAAVAAVAALTLLEWVSLAAAARITAEAAGISISFPALLGLLTANFIAFALPARSSGAVGVYEAAGTAMLTLVFGMAKAPALALVLLFHFVMLASSVLGGVWGLWLAGLRWSEIRTGTEAVETT
jgi:uncharacterized protein (TIRG00374 family)